jgi:hypothetical protein
MTPELTRQEDCIKPSTLVDESRAIAAPVE